MVVHSVKTAGIVNVLKLKIKMINATFVKTIGPDDASRVYTFKIPDNRFLAYTAKEISKQCEHNLRGCAKCHKDKPVFVGQFGVERIQLSQCPRTSDTL